ncbi:hypothetical protein GKA01_15900 [Gluconobacter kanchanaburiensis NBRC 103587]|uniref:Uncharacterized protein n=1 Tax=Gluconobacter kanchanaburiensis NBRC 103587 TaxID=1307948 RepID=A0A511B9Q8_9PROT|nr:ribonuclease I [Gluconobacter kanchanaburiensis NBRC 103587]GEK96393.1 hypothetical protein GKA01_15900 [Gluconobacter kanchanaburiensis NBRC 103587]
MSLTGCAGTGPLKPVHGRQFSAYTLEVGWTPSLKRTGSTSSTETLSPPARTLYLWAFRGSIPKDLQKAGLSADDWRERGCRAYGPVHFPPVALSPTLQQAMLDLTPGETVRGLSWDYQIRAACLGFPQESFFQEARQTYAAFSNSAAGTFLRDQAGRMVHRDALLHELAASLGTTETNAIRLRCATDAETRESLLDRIYIGIRARRLARFPAPSSLADEAPASDACPETFLIPEPARIYQR